MLLTLWLVIPAMNIVWFCNQHPEIINFILSSQLPLNIRITIVHNGTFLHSQQTLGIYPHMAQTWSQNSSQHNTPGDNSQWSDLPIDLELVQIPTFTNGKTEASLFFLKLTLLLSTQHHSLPLFSCHQKLKFCSAPRWPHVKEGAGLSIDPGHKFGLVQADHHEVSIPFISGPLGNEYETKFWPIRWEIMSYWQLERHKSRKLFSWRRNTWENRVHPLLPAMGYYIILGEKYHLGSC